MNTTTTRTVALASVIAGALASVAVTGGFLSPAAAADTTTATTTVSTSESAGNEGLAALVQPSVVYETITYTGYVYDPYLNGGEFLDDAAEFSATFTCSGFVVDPDGYIATAGHCLDMEAGKRAVAEAGAQWAIDTDFYTENYSKDELADSYEVHTYDPELDKLYNKVDRTVKVSWGASVSGIGVEKRLPARVIGVNSFDDGDTALIKVDETGLNAIDLAEETPEINTDVVTVGYPGLIETYTDHDLVPTFTEGTVSSTKTIGDPPAPATPHHPAGFWPNP